MKRWLLLLTLSIVACGRVHNGAPDSYSAGRPALEPAAASGATPPPAAAASLTPPPAAASGATPPSAAASGATPPPAAASGATPPPAAASVHVLLRIVEQSGAHDDVSVPGVGRVLSTGKDGRLAFDLPNGTRVHLDSNSRACVLEFEPSALLLYSGSALAELLPQGNPAGLTGLRLIGSQASLAVPNLAEVFMAERAWPLPAPPLGALATQSYLAIVRGSAELQRFSPEAALRVDSMSAGQDLSSGLGPKASRAKSSADLRRAGAELLRRRRDAVRLLDVDARLERVLAQVVEERQRGTQLLARLGPGSHAPIARTLPPSAAQAPVDAPSAQAGSSSPFAGVRLGALSEVRSYQRALASHAQRKLQLKQTLLLALEQSLFAALATCAAHNTQAASCDSLSTWRTRYLERIAGAL
jgi:hypothetical protein